MSRWLALLALCALSCAEPSEATVSEDVALRIEREGRARVLVLHEPGARLGSSRRRALPRVGGLQASSLVLDARELRVLEHADGVRAIALDHAGGGHLLEALPLAGFGPVQTAQWMGSGITVAVIDTGIDVTHPDLAGKVIDEACFCGLDCCPNGTSEQLGAGSALDDNGHGTHVAGSIASTGESASPRGAAPGAQLIAIKVLDENTALCCMSDVIAALDWLREQHPEVDVVNLSLGSAAVFGGDCDAADATTTAVAAAIDAITAQGALVVASSGNGGAADGMALPACARNALSVGAVWDEDVGAESIYCSEPMTAPDRIACFSNASATTDVLAPARITSTWLLSGARIRVGTSNAAPIASGCAAALAEAYPLATPASLGAALRVSPAQLHDARNGRTYPRLDCGAALASLGPDAGVSDAGIEDAGFDAAMPALDASFDAALPILDASADAALPRLDASDVHDASGEQDAALTVDAASAVDAADVIDARADERDASTPPFDTPDAADATPRTDASIDAASSEETAERLRRGTNCACSAPGAHPSALDWRALGWIALALAWRRPRTLRSPQRVRARLVRRLPGEPDPS